MKCPLFKRRVGAYDWKGIKCSSEKFTNHVVGHAWLEAWNETKRENHIKEFCNGDYQECVHYKNHMS